MSLKLKISRDELSRIIDQKGPVMFSKTWNCDPEYVVIRLYRNFKEFICGKNSK